MFLELCTACVLLYSLWSLINLERNYKRALSMGIPLIRVPIDSLNIPWQVIEPHLWRIAEFFHLPLPSCTRYMRRGWYFADKARAHLEFGPIYAIVTPREIFVQLCDSEAIHEVFNRRGDFVRPARNYKLLDVFGPSISTASPENWARHRKVLATPFMNESIMQNVWNESVRQTQQMLEIWDDSGILSSVAADTRTLSLNVLAAIGFRQVFDFRRSQKAKATEGVGGLSYRDALKIALDNVILIMMIPRKYLTYSWLPAWMRRIGFAGNEFQRHMKGMVEAEMESLDKGEKSSGSLISSLVRALDTHQKDRTKGMSIEEIYGNLFVINFAGHDTTANTLAFAFLLLVAYPEV